MPPPTLHYAPATSSPVRFGFIALASALILAATVFIVLARVLVVFLPASATPESLSLYFQIVSTLQSIAILAAVFLFNAALPPLQAVPKYCAPFLAAAAFAVASLLLNLINFLFFLALPAHIRSTSSFFKAVLAIVSSFGITLHLALLAAAALFFYFTARRLHRQPLGIIAAAAFAPNFLLTVTSLLFNLYLFFTPSPHFNIISTFSYASAADLLIQLLLWLTLALFTAILALKQPRPPASTPL